jgi:hypothetical protein
LGHEQRSISPPGAVLPVETAYKYPNTGVIWRIRRQGHDAEIARRVSVVGSPETQIDDKVSSLAGTGAMGVLHIPVMYNGRVQNLAEQWKAKLTVEQQGTA